MDMSSYDPTDDDDAVTTTFSDPMSDQEDGIDDAITGHCDDEESD